MYKHEAIKYPPKSPRSIIELLEVLLEYPSQYFSTGLCYYITLLNAFSIISDAEKYLLEAYFKEYLPPFIHGGSVYRFPESIWIYRKAWILKRLEKEIKLFKG